MAPKEENKILKYAPFLFTLLVALMTGYGGYKVMQYQVEELKQRSQSAIDVDKVRIIVREEMTEIGKRMEDRARMGMERSKELENRVQTIEKVLYRHRML